jgi:tetratricopeptide (TPR) repeat protein
MKKPLLGIALVALVLALLITFLRRSTGGGEPFDRVMTTGQGFLEKGDATNAIVAYSRAVKLVPESIDAHLNLANAYLLAGANDLAIQQAQEALTLDRNNPAAYYLQGCAWLHLNEAEKAVQAFQESQKIDPAVTALNFQLALAQERAGHLEDAIREFEMILQFEPDHPSVHYQLSRLYQRVGRTTDAAEELKKHQEVLAKSPGGASGPAVFERCKYTQPRIAFTLEQPNPRGIPVRFENATAAAFGSQAAAYRGPVGVLDYTRDGRNRLFVVEGAGFRLLDNVKGKFTPLGDLVPAAPGASYRRCLVGDLNNDRVDDAVMLGEQASHVFRFATNGQFREITAAANLKGLKARDGLLADLDFTGRLDLLTLLPEGQGVITYRNLGNAYFQQNTNSGLPAAMPGINGLLVEDLNDEDVPGVLVSRVAAAPLFFAKQRAGSFVQTNFLQTGSQGGIIAVGDLNNDLRLDLVTAGSQEITIFFAGTKQSVALPLQGLQVKGLSLIDYDNDGWLDIVAYGSGLRVWRNRGQAGFEDVTIALGLAKAVRLIF